MAGNGIDVGGIVSMGTAGLIGVSTMKMIGDTAKGKAKSTFSGGTTQKQASVPVALTNPKKQEKYLDTWYQHFPAVYGRYHMLYNGKRKDMIAYFYEDDRRMYEDVKAHYDNIR